MSKTTTVARHLVLIAVLTGGALAAGAEGPASEGTPESVAAAETTPAAPLEVSRYLLDTGPLRIRDQFLLGMGFLAFDPVSADVLAAGAWQVDAVSTVTNTFAHSPAVEDALDARSRQPLGREELRDLAGRNGGAIFHADGELYRFAIAARRGIGRGRQLEIVVPVLSFQGGSLDGTIESFHDTFGFGQAGRIGQPRGAVQAFVATGGRELYAEDLPDLALGDVVVGVKQRLRSTLRGTELAVEGLVKLPSGDSGRLTGTGSVDVGAQLLATRYFKRSCVHAAVGVLALGGWDELGIGSQTALSGMAAWEIGFGPTRTLLLQGTVSQTPFRDLGLDELSAVSTQLTIGAKQVVRGGRVLFVGVTENVVSFDNTADIGLHLGLTSTF
jgi:hypothetical protein